MGEGAARAYDDIGHIMEKMRWGGDCLQPQTHHHSSVDTIVLERRVADLLVITEKPGSGRVVVMFCMENTWDPFFVMLPYSSRLVRKPSWVEVVLRCCLLGRAPCHVLPGTNRMVIASTFNVWNVFAVGLLECLWRLESSCDTSVTNLTTPVFPTFPPTAASSLNPYVSFTCLCALLSLISSTPSLPTSSPPSLLQINQRTISIISQCRRREQQNPALDNHASSQGEGVMCSDLALAYPRALYLLPT
ncbi:uncharacterized protein LACBIDRAFT_325505 [Laccaria bicolor S238N-H82]|uniref:Predicted protein n=1 Tax=Laccaria bicolor (strain S238N-H82 / ATCC MYA-4686) TaxID=486041 RepID=B0D555_LACBS|nr:uncharacterized protein LACBIDRAFT_325505 [Laccaria bicolor S238N-H82]EDR10680.1 predicted protein [Laccaria bicolor S238N-H82]|eukprot:XP_001879130.1 predicted protein [Laccaria bicolor S238N-H82]